MSLRVIHADLLNPYGYGSKVIVNIENVDGAWEQALSQAMEAKWKGLKKNFKKWKKLSDKGKAEKQFKLGETQFFDATTYSLWGNPKGSYTWVATILCLSSATGYRRNMKYTSFADGFKRVKNFAIANSATIHMPKVSYECGGASWDIIESLVRPIAEGSITVMAYA